MTIGGYGFWIGFGSQASLVELVVAAVEVGELLGPEPPRDLAGFAEAPDTLAGRVERDPHTLVLVFVPTGADAELEAAVGDHVHRGRHVGMDRGVAVGVARDHQAEAQARRLGREGRQQRPPLEAWAIQARPGSASKWSKSQACSKAGVRSASCQTSSIASYVVCWGAVLTPHRSLAMAGSSSPWYWYRLAP